MSSVEPVYTLSDLATWPATGTWLAVLGHPIAHSISPLMHNAALARIASTDTKYSDWHYVRFDVPPEQLAEALNELRAKGFFGLNLTLPHKVLALPHLARIDPAAAPIGAVNTLRACEAGWEAYNTDGYGMSAGIRQNLGLTLKGTHIILLGAGGAARGAAVECLQQGVASLSIANRTEANMNQLLADIAPLCPEGCRLRGFSPSAIPSDLPAGALVINATSAGLKPDDALPIDLGKLPRPVAVYDMIYKHTALLKLADQAGIPTAHGLSMLVNQGAKALSHWTGVSAEQLFPDMNSAALKAFGL